MLNLKQVRKSKEVSVPALANLSNVSRRTIQDAEARGDCRMSTAYKLAKALEVSLDDLWEPDEAGE